MAVMESLMAAKAAYNVGKGAFDWLNAKNKQFKLTPEERKARNQAARQSTLGMGGETFQTASNTLQRSAADASQKLRANAFAAGLEGSGVATVGQEKIQNLSQQKLTDLALRIADRNAKFRETASQRKEAIDMQIGQRKREFQAKRDLAMRQAATQFITSAFDFGIKSAEISKAKAAREATAAAVSSAQPFVNELQLAVAANDKVKGLEAMKGMASLDLVNLPDDYRSLIFESMRYFKTDKSGG
tara:strand:+ start:5684 stop:6415 length:732 start_codon:yes stop_codon:yes gene_type:complete